MRAILNLGAGNRIIPPDASRTVVNHDVVAHCPEINCVWNLNVLPWPWADEQFDEICARSVLEHLNHDLIASLNECWRITKPGGICEVKLPHWGHGNTWRDPTHRWQFDERCFEYFDPRTVTGRNYSFYTPYKWHIIRGPEFNSGRSSFTATLCKVELA